MWIFTLLFLMLSGTAQAYIIDYLGDYIMIDRKKFYDTYRKEFPGKLLQRQVTNLELWLDAFEADGTITDLNQFAYILATIYHETAHTYKAKIKEYGRGKKRKYGIPDGPYRKIYYGRGPVQLTWLKNYEKQSKKWGEDFVKDPDKVMEMPHAWNILAHGMIDGDFTGKSLSHYVNETKLDFKGARRVVNGTDRAKKIMKYALRFQKCLES